MIILCSAIIISLSNSNIINIALNSTNKYKLTQFQTDLEIKLASLYMNNEPLINGTHNITDLSINFGDYTPISGWINIINKQITDYTLYFKDFYVLRSNNSFNVYKNPNIESTDVIDISSFGAKGDGKTDDTLAIRKAVDYLNINGGTLYFPTGQYIVSVSSDKESIINIESDKPIVIDFGSSTVSLKGNSYPYYNIMNINKSDNVVIQNGFLMGDRLNHNYNPGNTSHCWGYGIKICNTLKCDIINMNISQLTGDGIVNSISERGGITTINNCNIHHCRRIGIQVADADVINISNSNIHYIGDYDNIAGVNPKSGIDLEPVFGTKKINDLSLDNTNISSTTLYGIVKGDNHIVNKFTITNCNIENLSSNSANIYNSTLTFKNRNGNITGSKLYNCYINLTKMNGLALGIWEGTTISDSIIEGIDTSKSTSKGCKLVYKTNDCTVQNTKFLNILGINKNHTSSIEDYGIVMNSSSSLNNWQNNTYTNCSFGLAIPLMNDTNSTIKDSYIMIATAEISFEQMKVINTDTSKGIWPTAKVFINNCEWNNSELFGKRKLYITNSNIIWDNIVTSIPAELISVNNSKFNVRYNCTKDVFKNVIFSNNSEILLEQYNSNVKLNIPSSNEGTDYTVKYNGTQSLTS